MAGLRAAQKEMTRKLLLHHALEQFSEHGYAATTIDGIAQAAGTTRVTFYAYFPAKQDVVRALVEQLNETHERISSPTHGSTERALVEVVASGDRARMLGWLEAASERWDTSSALLGVAFEAAAVDRELRGVVDGWFEEAIADVEEGLDVADRFPAATRHTRGVLALAQLDYVARHWNRDRWKTDKAEVLDVLADGWAALLAEPAPVAPGRS